MALIDHNMITAIWISIWYMIVNSVIGNILEPCIMGRGLELSPLTIFLSMIFWGWMFGPTGMILSVPLTMGVQFLFDQYEETKWLAFTQRFKTLISVFEALTFYFLYHLACRKNHFLFYHFQR